MHVTKLFPDRIIQNLIVCYGLITKLTKINYAIIIITEN